MKKFLVLGIGNAQVDLLRYLKSLGDFEVHALSNSASGRGLEYVDKFEIIDITDKDSVLAYAKQHEIDIVYSVGSDVAMPTVAYVSEQLASPSFVSYDAALICNNKNLFRQELAGSYGAVPHVVVNGPSELALASTLKFPVIVKPVDSQGQRGVGTAHDADEITVLYKEAVQHSRSGKVIIEEKVPGQEISVNAYLVDGNIEFFLPSGRISWAQFDGGIIHKHYLPSDLSELAISNVKRLVKETLAQLGIDNGPAYFQIKMDGEIPFLIEVTPRFDGCHMWRVIREACDVDLLKLAVGHLATGQCQAVNQVERVAPFCLEFHCQPPGEEFIKPEADDSAIYEELYYKQGDTVRKMNGKMEKCGYKIFPTQ